MAISDKKTGQSDMEYNQRPRTKAKGISVITIQKLLRNHSEDLEKKFKANLSKESCAVYEQALPVSWIDLAAYGEIVEQAAYLLFPDEANPITQLGKESVVDNFRGIYGFMMKFTTVAFLFNLGPKVWRVYFDKGEATVEQFDKNGSGLYSVRHVPEMPHSILEHVGGGIIRFFELVDARNIEVRLDESDPGCWRWFITWTPKE